MFKSELAYNNWKSKYRYGNEEPLDTFKRVAKALASVEKEPGKWEETFLRTLVKFDLNGEAIGLKSTPGGRITANIGTSYEHATLLNCFISGPVSNATIKYRRQSDEGKVGYDVEYTTDNTPDDLTNIFLSVLEQAKTLATEGGYGINFSFIRPRGSLIKGIGIKHPGVLAYMDVWDEVSNCIVRGTNDGYMDKLKNYIKDEEIEATKTAVKAMARKGAMMAVLDCSHPDIEEFVRAKQESGRLTKFNMSVLISDEFMQAVERDDFFDLTFNGKKYKTLKARDLYDLIMEATYNRNEPGVLFSGNMDRNNPISYLGKLTCTNPCGEIGGLASLTTVCLLGSVNLTQYVLLNELGERTFDWDSFIEDVKTFTRMLDNVNDLSYISLPSYQWATDNLRQFGMGVNGLGSALMMLGIPYNSQAAVDFTKKICQLKENITWQTSALLAKEKGTFQGYIKEKFENTEYFKSDRLSEETKNMLRKYGARNAKTTTNPPLGNTSVITGTSNGIEPVFNLEYERVVICKEWPKGLSTDNIKNLFEKYKGTDHEYWRDTYEGKVYHYEPHNRGLCEVSVVRDYGYQWLLDNLPNVDHSPYLITTGDLNIEDHLRIQEVVQYYNNQSVSKCLMVGQKVETDKGLISIEDFCDEKYTEEGFYKAKKLKVYGSDGSLVPVIKSYYGGKKPCYTIKFNNGISINAGENHKFKNPEGFIKTKDLKVGDYIVFENMSFVHGTGGLKIDFDLKSLTHHYYKDITLPETLSEDLALFLGMLASDGGWSWPSVRLTEKKKGVGKLYKSLAKKLFNIDRTVSYTDKRNGVKTHSINSVPLCRYIESLMGKSTANQKRVPEQILNGSEAEKKAFIKGLSLDGYYVEQKMSFVPYCGVSEELAKGLHQICLQIFGYDTYYFEKTSTVKLKKGLVLDYKTYGVSIWKNGEPSNSKYDLAIEEHKNKKGRFKNCIVYVPFSDIEKLPRTKGTENLYSIRGIYQRKSPYILRKTADTLGINYTKVVQVSSIEYLGEQEVFDIEVGNNHEYLVSNIVTHNTANLPNKYPFEEFKTLYHDAWKRGLNGFTTYRDGTMESVISNIKKNENTRGIITKDIKLPNSFLNGPTSVIKRQGYKFYIHFSYLPEDTDREFPVVMWIYTNARYVGEDLKICNKAARNLGKLALSKGINEEIVTSTLEKAKSDYPHNRLGRMVSLNLRHNVPREDILAALMGIDGDNISTLVTAVRKFLSATLPDGTRLKGVRCDNPECTGTRLNVILESGCKKCLDCGASSCGA